MIRLSKPIIGKAEEKEMLKVLKSGYLSSGSYVKRFEEKFSSYLGVKFSVATSSGTTALDVALKAAGVNKGSYVLTTPFSFIATSNAILYQGAIPVFADIDPLTFNLSPEGIEEKIKKNRKIKTLLLVHLFGLPCDMAGIKKIVNRFNLTLIEDCAQAVGAEFSGRKVGTFGKASTFSFYATKNITSGEGGMVVCNNKHLKDRFSLFINHGSMQKNVHPQLGYNYRLTNLAAALGLCQLKKIKEFNKKRIRNAGVLSRAFQKIDWLIPPRVPEGHKHVFHQYTIRLKKGVRRDYFIKHLKGRKIEAGVFYPYPIYQQPLYKRGGYGELFLPNVERISREVVSLPVHPGLNQGDLKTIIEAVLNFRA